PGLSAVTSFVGLSASGNLSASASALVKLRLGVDLDDGTFFLRTGANGTTFTAQANATASSLAFKAALGPFGIFVNNGSAAVGGQFGFQLQNADGDGKLVLFGADDDLGDLGDFVNGSSFSFTGTANIGDLTACPAGNIACAKLPLFVGTDTVQVPI